MKTELINFYNSLDTKINNTSDINIDVNFNFIDGAYVSITNAQDETYRVDFINQDNNQTIFSTELKDNMWAKCSIRYYLNYKIKIYKVSDNTLVFENNISLKNKKVYISFESKSLGDTLAWIPQVEEFRKKHNCELIVSTFLNDLFKHTYPNITFVNPGTKLNGLYAKYDLGWFWKDEIYVDTDRHPNDFRLIPLGKSASDILGLDYKEIKPKLDIPFEKSRFNKKYVCIATQSTAQAKYWNKIGGWDKVVSYLKSKGYEVVDIDKYHTFGSGNTMNSIPKKAVDKTGELSLKDRMIDLQHAEFFIGLGSGLSWLSWAVGTPTILISSFSKPFAEFEGCIRVYKDTPYSGFFNDTRFRLNPSDWNWNPHKECQTFKDWDNFEPIEVEDVIDAVNDMIEGVNYPHKVIDDIGQEYDPTQIRSLSSQVLHLNSRAIGDTISGTPILNKLFTIYDEPIDVYTHHPEIFLNNPKVNNVIKIESNSLNMLQNNYKENNIHKTFVNVGEKINGVELKHNVCDIRQFHAINLGFMLTDDEMQCEFHADEYQEIKNLPKKYVVVHPTKTWKSRSWSQHNWQQLINSLNQKNISVVAIGKTSSELGFWGKTKKPLLDIKIKNGINLMDKTSLSQTWHIIDKADLIITLDSGILHLAGTTDTHILQIGSSINPKFRAPYRNGSQDYKYDYVKGDCDWCGSDMKWGVKEWGTIQGVPPIIECLPSRYSDGKILNKDHPSYQKVWNKCKEIIK